MLAVYIILYNRYYVKLWYVPTDDFGMIDWVGEFEFPNSVLKDIKFLYKKKPPRQSLSGFGAGDLDVFSAVESWLDRNAEWRRRLFELVCYRITQPRKPEGAKTDSGHDQILRWCAAELSL